MTMGTKGSAVGLLLFMMVFMAVMMFLIVYSVFVFIDGDAGFGGIFLFVLTVMIIFVIMIAVIVVVSIRLPGMMRRSLSAFVHHDTGENPMDYERTAAPSGYCRFCGANLGGPHTAFCPGCGKNQRY